MTYAGPITTSITANSRGLWLVTAHNDGKFIFKKKFKHHPVAERFASMLEHGSLVHVTGKRITIEYI